MCLGDGQTETERVPSQGGRGDALLRRKPPYLTKIEKCSLKRTIFPLVENRWCTQAGDDGGGGMLSIIGRSTGISGQKKREAAQRRAVSSWHVLFIENNNVTVCVCVYSTNPVLPFHILRNSRFVQFSAEKRRNPFNFYQKSHEKNREKSWEFRTAEIPRLKIANILRKFPRRGNTGTNTARNQPHLPTDVLTRDSNTNNQFLIQNGFHSRRIERLPALDQSPSKSIKNERK